LLVRQYRHPVGRVLWELPPGLLDNPGEEPLEAAQRELAEATGVQAASWAPLIVIHTSPGMSGERVQIFAARGISPAGGDDRRDSDEGDIEPAWVPLAEAIRMARRGETPMPSPSPAFWPFTASRDRLSPSAVCAGRTQPGTGCCGRYR
jgi:8-oxo-dGDP phosphatase